MRKALIKNGIVENIIVADDSFSLDGFILQDIEGQTVAIGDIWNGHTFVKPEPEIEIQRPTTEEEIETLKQSIAELTYIIAMGGM